MRTKHEHGHVHDPMQVDNIFLSCNFLIYCIEEEKINCLSIASY